MNLLSIKDFISKYKWAILVGIISIAVIVYIWFLKNEISDLNKEIADNKITITELENENENLTASLKKIGNEIELKETAIIGLQEKNQLLSENKNDEVSIWKQKYNYCIKTKNNNAKLNDNSEVMNNEASNFYIDLYNNSIFK